MSTDEHEELSHALEELADRQPPPGSAPTADLLRRGRRRRLVRSAAMTGTAVAVAAVALGGLFAGTPVDTAAGIGPAAGATVSDKPTGSAKPSGTPSTKPTGSAKPSGTPTGKDQPKPSGTPSTKTSNSPVLNPRVEELLAARRPAGYRLTNAFSDPDPEPGSGVRYRVVATEGLFRDSDRRGGDISMAITHVQGMPQGATYQPNPSCGGASNCTVTHRPDGSVLMVTLSPAVHDIFWWEATLYRTDGSLITARERNSPEMGEDPVFPPILDGDQLAALALDPVWTQVVDQLEAQFH
ncbi:hypothetical protein [Kitasatospora sp. NPDC004531]